MRGLTTLHIHNIYPMSQLWNNERFCEIMRTEWFRKAFEYRRDMTGEPIPAEHLTEEEKNGGVTETPAQEEHCEEVQSPEGTPVVTEAPELHTEEPKKEYTVDEVKAKLTEAGVKFHHMAGPAKIMELAIENNLI